MGNGEMDGETSYLIKSVLATDGKCADVAATLERG